MGVMHGLWSQHMREPVRWHCRPSLCISLWRDHSTGRCEGAPPKIAQPDPVHMARAITVFVALLVIDACVYP